MSLQRAYKSLTAVKSSSLISNIEYRAITFFNLTKKFKTTVLGGIPSLKPWRHKDTVFTVNFFGLQYSFICPKDSDYNIFLNPYFHEFDICRFVINELKSGDVFVDVGAHGGLYTILSSLKVGETGKVYSIEPNPINIIHLKHNLLINGLHNVKVIPKAAGEKETVLCLNYDDCKTNYTTVLNPNAKNHIYVKTTTLDEELASAKTIKILKVDTEEYDLQVLQGGKRILSKAKYVVVEDKKQEIQKLLVDAGFSLTELKPSRYLLAINQALE